MAEAAVETNPATRFFCHQCNQEIAPNLPDYTCPWCQGGFIEQLSTEESRGDDDDEWEDADTDPAAEFTELWERMFTGRLGADHPAGTRSGRRRARPRTRIAIRQRLGGPSSSNAGSAAAIDLILQNLLASFGQQGINVVSTDGDGPSVGLFPFNMLQLHGNPGDYVWGTNGLDSIITQLLNQLEGAGPPPAENDKIENLPKVKVTQSLIDSRTECAVCQEQLKLHEEVLMLPCNHHYHKDCIIPWLKMHDSCPICRLSLSKNQTRSGEETEEST
ncbi:E3 ubiquitin-protein ligase RNF115 [Nematostella vectensis]|nr:E3 ubiquitin-protein ligase RNF115 [Nematostella vectensis]